MGVNAHCINSTIDVLGEDGAATVTHLCWQSMMDKMGLNRIQLSFESYSLSIDFTVIHFLVELFTGISDNL